MTKQEAYLARTHTKGHWWDHHATQHERRKLLLHFLGTSNREDEVNMILLTAQFLHWDDLPDLFRSQLDRMIYLDSHGHVGTYI